MQSSDVKQKIWCDKMISDKSKDEGAMNRDILERMNFFKTPIKFRKISNYLPKSMRAQRVWVRRGRNLLFSVLFTYSDSLSILRDFGSLHNSSTKKYRYLASFYNSMLEIRWFLMLSLYWCAIAISGPLILISLINYIPKYEPLSIEQV